MSHNDYLKSTVKEAKASALQPATGEKRMDNIELWVSNQLKNGLITWSVITFIYLPGLSLSMIVSYSINESIGWAIAHGYLSWVYIFYSLIF